MANFYITKDMIQGTCAVIDNEEARHIKNVLRMKKGDELVLCDGEGNFHDAVIKEIGEKSVEAEIIRSYTADLSMCRSPHSLSTFPFAGFM